MSAGLIRSAWSGSGTDVEPRAYLKVTRAEDVVEGEPLLVVENGAVIEGSVRSATISRRELMMLLRGQDVRDVGELARAFFEPNGKISIVQADQESRKQTESTQPKDFKRR